jgi:putative SOS response-associated peptidase YedK
MSAGQVRDDGEKHSNVARRSYVMLTTEPNETVRPFHHHMPLIVRPENYADWLGEDWQKVLAKPDQSPLDIFQKQPELF